VSPLVAVLWRRVLVMEYLEGTQLTDLAAIKSVTAVDSEQVLIK
jgi:predicted unusual protein kinase regulating ubiquinone biosynthesis (AarF/ABC1/UbiB family)